VLILFLGNRFSWDQINIRFVPIWFKFVILGFIFFGFLLINSHLVIKGGLFLWVFKKIKYLKTLKTYFYTKKVRNLGAYYQMVVDNGA